MHTITLIERVPSNCARYRVVAQPETQEWLDALAERGNPEPWCEFSVWDGSQQLGSYGGEVWPGAWPTWFTKIPGSVQGGSAASPSPRPVWSC